MIVWFRRDLRLADNLALSAAVAARRPVVPVFVFDPREGWGEAQLRWLRTSLADLGRALGSRGLRLILRAGPAVKALAEVASETKADRAMWNRRIEPIAQAEQAAVEQALIRLGVQIESHGPNLLFEPGAVVPAGGGFYKVFGAFLKACRRSAPPHPMPSPDIAKECASGDGISSVPLDRLLADASIGGHAGDGWTPGETGAQTRLAAFMEFGLAGYARRRDRLDEDGTSRLSPHLAFGELSARQVWAAASLAGERNRVSADVEKFLSELCWREFSHHLLHHVPALPSANFRPAFDAFPWRDDARLLEAWQNGQTGYPLIDAAMRELRATGWMPNRARMVAASFLVKHLLIDWRAGERWFRQTLIDADLANNAVNWQWVAGSGVDAAPYFRIFNPTTQAEKFDPAGNYVRRWVPELGRLSVPFIHQPWTAPQAELTRAGVEMGKTYPDVIVDHTLARKRALECFAGIKG